MRILTKEQKEVAKIKSREWYKNNRKRALKASKIYRLKNKEAIKISRKKSYENNKESYKKRQREYVRKNYKKVMDHQKLWYLKNRVHVISRMVEYSRTRPLQVKCRRITYNLVKSGILNKFPCRVCGNKKVDAHHPDYTKPYKVIWLCKKHHFELHRKYK